MRVFSKLSIVVSHDYPDGDEDGTYVEMTNGHSSIEIASLESALGMLPPGSRVQVVARGTVGNKTVHRISRIIRESCVLVVLDMTDVTECSRVFESPFQRNDKLLSIRFPGNLVSISPHAFTACTALEAVYIPASCALVGAGAFVGCSRLHHLEFAETGNWYYDTASGATVPLEDLRDATENAKRISFGALSECRLFKSTVQQELSAAFKVDFT